MTIKSRFGKTLVAFVLALTLITPCAMAQDTAADLDALNPLMDVVAAAAMQASDLPETVTEDGVITNAFVSAMLNTALVNGSLGVTESTLADATQQQTLLSSIFASELPTLGAVTQESRMDGYLGLQPMNVTTLGDDGRIQVVGEMYWAPQKLSELGDDNGAEIEWLQPAVYIFKADSAALGGYRLLSFSVGTEIDMESTLGEYFSSILVEYEDNRLGFSVQYPAVFAEDEFTQDENSISAELKDGTAGFRCEKMANADKLTLEQYVAKLQSENPTAKMQLNDELGYLVMTKQENGSEYFTIAVVTGDSIYQAQLRYAVSQKNLYQVYTHYLENSFIVFEVSMG